MDANTRVIDTFSREIAVYVNLCVASSRQTTRGEGREREENPAECNDQRLVANHLLENGAINRR